MIIEFEEQRRESGVRDLDMWGRIEPMEEVIMEREEQELEIKKMKSNKAAGPNKLKAEIF